MTTVIYTMLSAALKRCFAALNLVVIMGNVCPLRDKLPQLILRPHDGRNDRGTIDDTADDGGYRRPRDAYLNKREGEGGFSESEPIDGEPP